MKIKIIGFFILLSFSFLISSCYNETNHGDTGNTYQCPMKCEGEKKYSESANCPVCNMVLRHVDNDNKIETSENEISTESIFNLTSLWNTQNNETIELKDLRGDVLVMVMIYTTCQAACPRLVADMINIHDKVDDNSVKYVLVSIDPATDTPERLKEFAIENHIDNDQWIFLQGTEDNVREFSNVLAVKYKKITPLDFSHSNIISVFDKAGVLYHQQEGLGVDNEITVSKIIELTQE